jgi:hypothetical protein
MCIVVNFDTDSDTDPNFHVDANAKRHKDQDLDTDRHQNDDDPHADPTPGTHIGKSQLFLYYHLYQLCQNIQYFERLIEILWKNSYIFKFVWN